MSDGEDYNEFNCWDSGGAAFLLALVPAVLYYVFSEHDKIGTLFMAAGAAVIALFVTLLARYTSSRMVSRVMQLAGALLCILYWVYAIHALWHWERFSPGEPTQETSQEAS